jgi:transposase
MKRQAEKMKQTRRRYSAEYRKEAVVLIDKIGVAAAAKQLGLHESQLYLWRSKTREQSDKGELAQQQMLEIAKLKRQLAERDEELAIIKKAAAYFAKNQK